MHTILNSSVFQQSGYYKSGQGFPIILLHGFAEDHSIWSSLMKHLEKDYLVIAPDLPGTGISALPEHEMSMDLLADFANEILEQEKIEKVIMLGHSMGGYAALAFAEKYENKLSAFSMIHSSAFADDEAKKENRRKSIKLIENEGREVFLKAMIPNLYSESSKVRLKREMDAHLTMALKTSSESMVAYYQAMINRPERISVLENTKLPVQFVIGTEDNAIPLAQSLKQCSIPLNSQIDILQGIGHSSMIEAPDQLELKVNSFCKYVLEL